MGQVTGFRKYKPPLVKKEEIKKNYDITNFHEVKSKFRFEMNGIFEGSFMKFILLHY